MNTLLGMELKNTDDYKYEIDSKRVSEAEYNKAMKITTSRKFEQYSYSVNGCRVFITNIK